MFTSASIVLAIGLDPNVTDAYQRPTDPGGVFLQTARTPTDALAALRAGDFDLVLIGSSLPPESRRRLVAEIRRFGLTLPVAYVADGPDSCNGCADCKSCTEVTIIDPSRPIAAHITRLLADRREKPSATLPLSQPFTMRRFGPRRVDFRPDAPAALA